MHRPLMKSDMPGYSVDKQTGAVLNTDEDAFIRFKAEREREQLITRMKEKIDRLEATVERLEMLINEKLNG